MDDYEKWWKDSGQTGACEWGEMTEDAARGLWNAAIQSAVEKLRDQGRILAAHSVEQLLSQGREVTSNERTQSI